MATLLDSALQSLGEEMGRFARAEIAPRRDIREAGTFPHDLWAKLAAKRLLGIGIPASYGGRGANYLALLVAEEALVGQGHNMGFALSWLIQEAIARFIVDRLGSKAMKERYLPELARGDVIAALAISEPGVGAHPKHLRTEAVRRNGIWSITGAKTMITNGPIADIFIVVAVTDQNEGRKAFTAFLVPKETPGFSLTDPIELGFLQPSRHGGIVLADSPLDETNVVGTIGDAYREIALPFREIEDMLLAGAVMGGFSRLLEMGVEQLRIGGTAADRDVRIRIGAMADFIDTLRIIAYEAAAMTDSGAQHTELPSLLFTFKLLAVDFLGMYRDFLAAAAVMPGSEGDALLHDLDQTIRIAADIIPMRRMKRGDNLLARKE